MTGLTIGVEFDTADWEDALDALIEECRAAGHDASVEGAHAIQRETRALLSLYPHPPFTKTPSEPGDPPGFISGALMDSVLVSEDGEYAEVGPTTDYGRIQELGGGMHGHPYMRYVEDGRVHYRAYVELPERPYLKPATDQVVEDGELTDIYYRAWADAQAKVTGP